MRILVDVMSGDRPPHELVKGGVSAGRRQSIDVVFAGDSETIDAALSSCGVTPGSRFDILPTREVIRMEDPPVRSVREKRDSSIVRGLQAVRDGDADAFVSPGNTGAVVAGSIFTLGRVAGIPRPGLLVALPSLTGRETFLIDVGANSDCQADHLAHFALMGAMYAREVAGIDEPQIGLLNIGSERGKGNRLSTEAYGLLESGELPFAGNVEAQDVLIDRPVDVVVCDGFVGNVFLKATEGGVTAVTSIMRRRIRRYILAKLGALFLGQTFSTIKKTLSYQRRGGAPLLGVDGVVVVAHGRSDDVAIESAIDIARRGVEARLTARFSRGLSGWSTHGI